MYWNVIKTCDAYCQYSKKKETQWTSGARYDPDAEDADQYLRNAHSSEEENDHSEEEGISEAFFTHANVRY